MPRASLALVVLFASCRGESSGGDAKQEPPPPPAFLPPTEVDAPGSELIADPLPWNPAFIAHHKIAGITITSQLPGSDRALEDSLRFDAAGHLVERHLSSGRDRFGTWGVAWKDDRVAQMTETLPGGASSRTTYRYDAAGRLVEIAHPDAPEKVREERTYDAAGALTSRSWTHDHVPAGDERFERDARGRLVAAIRQSQQGERMEERRTYQGDRLTAIDWTQPGGKKSWHLTYDPAGRIVRIDVDHAATQVFTYDERGFPLTRTKNAPPAPLETIEYDFDQPRDTP